MKREIERERKVSAFCIDVVDLENLLLKMRNLFDDQVDIYRSIKVSLPSEKIIFKDIDELKQYPNLKGKITKFTISMSQGDKWLTIRPGGSFSYLASVTATGESEAWCAGAVDTVCSFLESHRLWYHWIMAAPLGWIYFTLSFLTIGFFLWIPEGVHLDKFAVIGWLAALLTLAFLFLSRKMLFPSSVLIITETENIIRRHSAEISLIIALTSVVLSIIGLIVRK
jgi:hypothetical protein